MSYLVDTSVWINYFRGVSNQPTKLFQTILDEKIPYGITTMIYQELLQGAATEKDFKTLQTYLATQTYYDVTKGVDSYTEAAKIYFKTRKKGITIRSTIDCIITQIAIENQLTLLHHDKDFERIKKVAPKLKTDQ